MEVAQQGTHAAHPSGIDNLSTAAPHRGPCWNDLPQHLQMLVLAHAAAPLHTCRASACISHDPQLLYIRLLADGKIKQPLRSAAKLQQWDTCLMLLKEGTYGTYHRQLTYALVEALCAEDVSNPDKHVQVVHQLIHQHWVDSRWSRCEVTAPCQQRGSLPRINWPLPGPLYSILFRYQAHHRLTRWKRIARDPLTAAVHHAHIVRYLLQHFVLHGTAGHVGRAAVEAVKQDQLQALQLLLQHGTPGPQLERALQVAVKHRKPAAVSLLLQHRGRCANSDFLLHVASKRGSVEVVQMLMQNGVIDANSSAVVKALMGGNTDIKQVLAETVVTSGAASLERQVIRAVDLGAAGALDKLLCAAKQRSLQVPQHLLHSLVRTAITTFNKYGCCARGVRCVKVLISHGADLNAQHGAPLLAAVLRNNMPALRYLVSRGADVNAGGGAALRAAIDLQKLKSVTELVKAGADVDPTDLHLMLRLPLPSPYDSRAHEARSLTEALRARNLID